MLPARFVSSMIFFSRSSNWPRYWVPATTRAMSSATTRLRCIFSGTVPRWIACARPSTTAVLPTPASPTSTALFLVRRESTCIRRFSSLSRPITGSSFPCRARSVRSRPKVLTVGVFCALPLSPCLVRPSPSPSASPGSPSAGAAASASPAFACAPAATNACKVTPALKSSCAAAFSPSFSIACTRWTVPTGASLPASSAAISSTLRVRELSGNGPRCSTASETAPATVCRSDSESSAGSSPIDLKRFTAWLCGIARIDRRMCSLPMWSWPSCLAQLADAFIASVAFFVSLRFTGTSPPPARSASRPRNAGSPRLRARRRRGRAPPARACRRRRKGPASPSSSRSRRR